MSMADRAGMRRTAPIFLSHGFRPLFLAAGLWSPAALLLWIVIFIMGGNLPSRFDPLAWHIHEMLFGFVMATIAGFLLTAIPNWTGRPPISGAPLALLASLWLLGPVVCIVSELVPAWFAAMVDLSFSTVLARLVAREILAARNWRNLAMIGALGVFGTANLLMHLEGAGVAVTAGLGWRLGLAAVIVLISVVGGRIVPSFTRSWLAKRRVVHLPAMPGVVDQAALGTLHAGLFAWVFLPDQPLVGLLLILGSGFNLWRLLRWRGGAAVGEPLLLILHLGYAWLVLGVALLGLSMLYAGLPATAAIHALTAGAIGTMTLAVMTRATRGHTGRELSSDSTTNAIYILVTLAAVTRVAATIGADWAMPLLISSTCLWIAAFMGFVLGYGPMLLFRPPAPH
jgi:uncharacterized protein involved in response to NO